MDLTRRAQLLATDFERQLTDLARSMAEQVVAAAVAAANEVAQRLKAGGGSSERSATTRSSRSRPSPPRRSSPPSPSRAASQLRPSAPSRRSPEVPVAPRSPRPRAGSEKRKARQLSDLRERIVQCVERQPGVSVEELSRELGTTPDEVQHPLRMLLTRGVLRAEGAMLAARYFPQTRGWAAPGPRRRP